MGEPFPGPYSYKYHPWCREISDSTAPFNSTMKGAQLGITEVAINRAFYTIDILRRDVLYVLPTAINAADFSKSRFKAALLNSPYLESIFTDTNTISLKQAGGVNLYIRGSRGDSNLKSIPVSTLILDELDEMDQDQIWLALERLSGQREKSVWAISTPKIPNKGIHKLYMQGSQEQWIFKCPRCGRSTQFIWPDCVEIIGEAVTDPRCAESYLKCKECKGRIEQEEKPEFLATGIWVPNSNEFSKDHRSFHLNQLYSYTVTAGELVVAHFRGMGDEAAATEFHNSKLGIPYIGDGAKVTDEIFDGCLKGHTKGDARPRTGGERLITMGIDVGKLCHIVVMEWFMDSMGRDLNVAAMGKLLWEGTLLGSEFERFDYLMREWQILACVIDASPFTTDARRFARRFPGYVTLCNYRAGRTGKEMTVVEDELGTPTATVDRTSWMDASLGRFHSQRIMLPCDVSREFREHIKSSVRIYEKDNQNNYVASYTDTGPDHFAHALTYAEIALPLAASYVQNQPVKAFL
ncbi:MAG: terminase gpA endonuclease subunit [Candidatus Omnitrophota bacterium]